MIAHFGSSEQAQPLVTLYMLKTCAQYVKSQLKLPDDPPNDRKLPSKMFAHPILISSLYSLQSLANGMEVYTSDA